MENTQSTDEKIAQQPERFTRWRQMVAAGSLAIISTIGIQNHETISSYAPFFGEGSIIPDVAGCQTVPSSYQAIPLVEVNRETRDVRSVASNFEAAGIRPHETLEIIRKFYNYPQFSFVSDTSGIEFAFYSDTANAEWTINPDAFDKLFHFALATNHEYDHPHVNFVIDCLRDRLLNNKEFTGTKYSIFIPNNPRSCLGNGRIIDLDEQPDATCRQRGFAPPSLDLSVGPLTLFEGNIMILTGGRNDTHRQANLNQLANHESIHAHTVLAGLNSFQLHPNEKWAVYQERVLRSLYSEEFNEIEHFIEFHEPVET